MLKNLTRYQKGHKENYKVFIESINANTRGIKDIEFIFPLIHGIKLESNKYYSFYNIVEAREYLNNKTLNKNLLEACSKLLKFETDNIEEVLPKKEADKLKSSLTLFVYLTKNNISNLLLFRNYDKKITKIFTNNKKFEIFKKLLEKYFNGETDRETTLLIESEIYEYSNKEISLKNIEKKDLKKAEDLLIRYSELGPLEILNINKTGRRKKIKEFLLGFTEDEREILKKINKPDNIFISNKIDGKSSLKIIIVSLTGIIIFIIAIVLSINFIFKEDIPEIIKFSNFALPKVDEKIIIAKVEEKKAAEEARRLAEEEAARLAAEEEARRQAELNAARPTQNYTFVEPTGEGNIDMVNIASSQIGNIGGEPYWSWYGFDSHVPWCAVFVSWVANQSGIGTDIIPKFSGVRSGISWFRNKGLYRNKNYTARPGDLIFFDWNADGLADHVGLVKKVEGGRVITIEGNTRGLGRSENVCESHNYPQGSKYILGYGTPNY